MRSLWSEERAEEFLARYGAVWGEDLALRAYSGRLLGAEPSLVLHGGGNTSVKTLRADLLGEPVRALYVKSSGRDLASIEPSDHTGLDLGALERLRRLERLDDAAMAEELARRRLDPRAGAPSLETLAHAFLPETFLDHTHADAILALTNQEDGEAVVREALGGDVLYLRYIHPGFELACAAAEARAGRAACRGMVWAQHGLLTWGRTARESYEATIDLVTRAEAYLARKAPSSRTFLESAHLGRGTQDSPLTRAMPEARSRLARVATIVRGLLASPTGDPDRAHARMILAPLVDRTTIEILDAPGARSYALSPPLTTDHLIRTKAFPLWVDAPAYDDEARLRSQITRALEDYAVAYERYLGRHSAAMPAGLLRFDARPRVLLLPGLGALCAGPSLEAARIARDITSHTLRVKAVIAELGQYSGPGEDDLFRMEYRSFQHEKLMRDDDGGGEEPGPTTPGDGGARDATHPPPGPGPGAAGRALPPRRPLEGQTALVTGAAGAIGFGVCRELLREGCLVAASDLPGERLDQMKSDLEAEFGTRVVAIDLDVSDAASVQRGFERVAEEWGGVDLLVVNAGIAHAAPLESLDLESFRRLERVNVEGTLLLLSEAAHHFRMQATGGDIVLVSSKNVFAPGAGFGAYSATKAAAHQLARIASLEMAPLDVRVNMVAPDAVFSEGSRRSGLWEEIGPERMKARGLDPAGLEDYYRMRNLLKARITARHVGRAVVFFASRQAPMTGVTLPVDGGLPDATPR